MCRGVAWEDHIKELKKNYSNRPKGVTVRSFNQVSLGEKSSIQKIDNIGEGVNGGWSQSGEWGNCGGWWLVM